MASLHMMQQNFDLVEQRFKQCIEVAEKGKKSLNKAKDQTQNTFIWQNNLMKFYLVNDVTKAIDFALELIDESG